MEILIITKISSKDSEVVYFDGGIELHDSSDIELAAAHFKKAIIQPETRNLLFEKEMKGILYTCFTLGEGEVDKAIANRIDHFILCKTIGIAEIVEAVNLITKKVHYLEYIDGVYRRTVDRDQSRLFKNVEYKQIFFYQVEDFGLTGYTSKLSQEGTSLIDSYMIADIKRDLDIRVIELFYVGPIKKVAKRQEIVNENSPHLMITDGGVILHTLLVKQLDLELPCYAVFKIDLLGRLCLAFSMDEEYLEEDRNIFEVKVSKGARLPHFVDRAIYTAFIQLNDLNHLNLKRCFIEGYKYYVDEESNLEDGFYWHKIYREDDKQRAL